jgi:VIT1/CCC1 family predicted Fe2+/Mn2+ transporter
MIAGLLILGVADNITDSLSIHLYQESDRLQSRPAFPATLSNFATRLVISLTFVLLVLALPAACAAYASIAWGLSLLTGLTWLVARQRGASVTREVCKHVATAVLAIAVSRVIGMLILEYFH